MTADKISLLYIFAILDELRTVTLTQESLKGDMSEMIKFTYELKCFKDALEIRVSIFHIPFSYKKTLRFLITKNQEKICRSSTLTKSRWRQRPKRIMVRLCEQSSMYWWVTFMALLIMEIVSFKRGLAGRGLLHDVDCTSDWEACWSLTLGNKAYQAGKDLDALYLYSQV